MNNIGFILLAAMATLVALAMIDSLRGDYWPFFAIIGVASIALYALWKFQASFRSSGQNGVPGLNAFRKIKKKKFKNK